MSDDKKQEKRSVTIEQLRGKSYATFSKQGMRVDIKRYLETDDGKKAAQEIIDSAREVKARQMVKNGIH